MELQFFYEHIAGFFAGAVSLVVLLFRYRETIAFCIKLSKYPWRTICWVHEFVKMPFQLNKEAVAARQRMDAVENTLNELSRFVKKELTYNGGSSTLDAIRRIENRMIEQEFAQNALMLDGEHGIFRCDINGYNKWVNRTFARYLGCGTNELLGLGWKRFIRTEELKRYNEVWQTAFSDRCEFEDVVEFFNTNKQTVRLRILASPVSDEKGNVLSYVGTVIAL